MTGISVLILLVGLFCWGDVEGLSTGAPALACTTLAPLQSMHLNAPPQASPVPYVVDLSNLTDGSGNFTYFPGALYSLTVRSTDGNTFRGVLLQGRMAADDTTAVGSFLSFDSNLRLSDCSVPSISVTHNSATDKMSVTTLWTAPPAGTGDVRIGFAVVRERAIYWANQRTAVISEGELICPPGSMRCAGYDRECFPLFQGSVCPPPPIGECSCIPGRVGQRCCPPYQGCYPAGIQGVTCPPPPQVGNCTCSPEPITGQMCCPPYEGCFRAGFFGALCPTPPDDVTTMTTAVTAGQKQISGNVFLFGMLIAILMFMV